MSSVVETPVGGKSPATNTHVQRGREVQRILSDAWQEVRDRAVFHLAILCRAKRVARVTVRLVLLELGRYASWEYGDCYPSEQRVADRIERSVSQVRQALRVLEAMKLVETLTGQDALNVYGSNPTHDRRANAYRLVPLVRAWKSNRRAPLVDKRSSWQRHHARLGRRQKERQAARELERKSGLRAVYLPHLDRVELVPTRPGASAPQQSPNTTRRGQPVHVGLASPALAAIAPRDSKCPPKRQVAPTVRVQPQQMQPSQSADSSEEFAARWQARFKEARGGDPPRVPPRR